MRRQLACPRQFAGQCKEHTFTQVHSLVHSSSGVARGNLMNYQTYQHNRNYGCRITELVLEGHRCIALENEKLRVTIIADKGTDIYEFLYKPRDVGAHMDYYEGGWQELFPNCGGLSLHQGAEIGQHGEVLLLPWSYTITRDDPDEIEVRFEV